MPAATVTLIDYDTDEEIPLPANFEVCDRCRGTGTHDCWEGGMTASEMYEHGDEFIDDYFAGHYDKTCEECHGERVIAVVDEERCPPALLEQYHQQQREAYEYEAERRAEMRMGA